MKKFVSNNDESVRMFKSDFLEFFSHVHPITPAIIYIPVIMYSLYSAYTNKIELSKAFALLIFGAFVWSLTEYTLHRFVFHFTPQSKLGQRIHFIFHGVHHDYPNDSTRLVMPPAVSMPLAALFYFLFLKILGAHYLPPFFAGFIIGYLAYDLTHYAVHHFSLHGKISLYLKQHHMRHHYLNPESNYGVSSPLWDFIFGTFLKKAHNESMSMSPR